VSGDRADIEAAGCPTPAFAQPLTWRFTVA